MSNLMLMPESFKDFERETLIKAFFGRYYELVIALGDGTLSEDVIDFVRTSTKQTEVENELLWKHMWLAYATFVMNRMQYRYFCECVKKERVLLATTHDDDFIQLMAYLNVSSRALTRNGAMLDSPRFIEALMGDDYYTQEIKTFDVYKPALNDLVEKYRGAIRFRASALNDNPFMNITDFIIDGLLLLKTASTITEDSIYNCFSSVIEPENSALFKEFCCEVNHIMK